MKRIAYLGYGLIFLLASCSTDNPKKSLSYEEQLKKDIAEVDAYLAANSIKAIVDTTGVRYLVTKEGSGEKPAATSTVYVSGTVKVINTGVIFLDTKGAFQSFDLNEPANPVSLRAVLPLVKKGSVVTIYSPSGLAYGATSSSDGKLTANSNVIFDLSILDEVEQFTADTIAIEAYLKKNSIKAVKDPTGLRYVISVPGTGPKPIASSTITFNYEGKLLATDVTFDKSTSAPLTTALTSIIKGLQIGFPLISKGTKATFYIPSSLGYGPVSTSSIPGNSNLIFEIELLSIQ
jgi:FKBP-type peptidyl-prolyl cis-trans isomerase